MPSKQRSHAVLFDWDNTLVDSWSVIIRSMQITIKAMKQKGWSPEGVRYRFGHSMRDSFPHVFKERWQEAADIYYGHFLDNHLQELKALKGVEDMLTRLQASDFYIGVISNKDGDILRKEVEHLGWLDFFDTVSGAGDSEADKPDPLHAEHALNGFRPESLCIVGDSPVDMELAHRCRADAVLLHKNAILPEWFAEYPPHHWFRKVKEVEDWLLRQDKSQASTGERTDLSKEHDG